MGKIGPKEAARRTLRGRRGRPQERVKPVGGVVEDKPALEVPQRRAKAVLCAPVGECGYCDRRREVSRLAMRRLRARRAPE